MEIILKYYDKNLKLKPLKNNDNIQKSSIIRFKVLRNDEWPCCDFHGKCTNKAYAEVFLSLMKNSKKRGWSYLCKKHYSAEQRRLKWKLPACLSVGW